MLLDHDHRDTVDRLDDILHELARWTGEHPRKAGWAHERRLDTLLRYGRVDDVEREADAGDRLAVERLQTLRNPIGRAAADTRDGSGEVGA